MVAVLRTICTVVGAVVLYCALMAATWALVVRAGRRRARGLATRDPPWAVAVVLLGAPAVRHRTAPFVDVPNKVIDWAGMLEASSGWSRDQRLLVLTAYELASDPSGEPSEPVTLQDVVRHLDDDEVERIRVAMRIRRGRLEPDEGLTRLG